MSTTIGNEAMPAARAVGAVTFGLACLRVRGDCQNTASRPRAVGEHDLGPVLACPVEDQVDRCAAAHAGADRRAFDDVWRSSGDSRREVVLAR